MLYINCPRNGKEKKKKNKEYKKPRITLYNSTYLGVTCHTVVQWLSFFFFCLGIDILLRLNRRVNACAVDHPIKVFKDPFTNPHKSLIYTLKEGFTIT